MSYPGHPPAPTSYPPNPYQPTVDALPCPVTVTVTVRNPCPACGGQGGFDRHGKTASCMSGMKCMLCEGGKYVEGEYQQCPECKGKGGFDTWNNPCLRMAVNYKRDCHICQGKAYVRPGTAPQNCPACQGKGGFNTWGKPAIAGEVNFKMQCQLCDGSRVVTHPWKKCTHCNGLGGINTWDKPAHLTDMHFRTRCAHCQGKGYHPDTNGHTPYPPVAPPVTADIAGEYVDSAGVGTTVITQSGNLVTLSNSNETWSPSHGKVEGSRVIFEHGGLVGLTGDFQGDRIMLSNGRVWTKRGGGAPVNPYPAPQPAHPASVAGQWKEGREGDVSEIVQAGDRITITNTVREWSPSYGSVRGQRIVFEQGGLQGLTADVQDGGARLVFSNGCWWVRNQPNQPQPQYPTPNPQPQHPHPHQPGHHHHHHHHHQPGHHHHHHHHHHQPRGDQKCQGCSYLVTGVNPTHCCNACAARPGQHGPKCEHKPAMLNLSGRWRSNVGPDITTIEHNLYTQEVTFTNGQHPWTGAKARVVDGKRISMLDAHGPLAKLNPQYCPQSGAIKFNNGIEWFRAD